MDKILNEIKEERIRQIEKYAKKNSGFTLSAFLSILTEEVGEAAKDINDINLRSKRKNLFGHLRTELVQVAATAVQIIEHLDETYLNTKN
ncbi:nucleoside triphosphate pyrophosphohydrolase family protein [Elizabethkingia anophelis]|uniref:hypothetical protein n=1 Tax=Elizabethkingia anophelis TaxID=1117645 RepID=UPI0013198C84|nr:hypothetical protein [Elizabethkingia anophelis]BBQ07959.1 hypothetical protein JUNP353_2530 [Elizabethkingia anophelis]